jgi:3-oxoacyl-[acyl-carrier protein] reductase
MNSLNGKVILITGSSRGIGAEVAKVVALSGAKVIINYAGGKDAAEKIVSEINSNGGESIAIQANVSISSDVTRLFDLSIAHFGRIDVLINNAGIMFNKLIKDTLDDDIDKILAVNVKGVLYTLREAATKLADNGSIINFSTSGNRIMMPTYGPYVATKAAVEQLTRVFAKEIGSRGINVNSVSPGPTNTELFMTGKPDQVIAHLASLSAFNRIGEPEDIARVVAFLASDDANWISAQNIGINGGMA